MPKSERVVKSSSSSSLSSSLRPLGKSKSPTSKSSSRKYIPSTSKISANYSDFRKSSSIVPDSILNHPPQQQQQQDASNFRNHYTKNQAINYNLLLNRKFKSQLELPISNSASLGSSLLESNRNLLPHTTICDRCVTNQDRYSCNPACLVDSYQIAHSSDTLVEKKFARHFHEPERLKMRLAFIEKQMTNPCTRVRTEMKLSNLECEASATKREMDDEASKDELINQLKNMLNSKQSENEELVKKHKQEIEELNKSHKQEIEKHKQEIEELNKKHKEKKKTLENEIIKQTALTIFYEKEVLKEETRRNEKQKEIENLESKLYKCNDVIMRMPTQEELANKEKDFRFLKFEVEFLKDEIKRQEALLKEGIHLNSLNAAISYETLLCFESFLKEFNLCIQDFNELAAVCIDLYHGKEIDVNTLLGYSADVSYCSLLNQSNENDLSSLINMDNLVNQTNSIKNYRSKLKQIRDQVSDDYAKRVGNSMSCITQ